MENDIFNYIVNPTVEEYRKENIIDKLYDIKDTYDDKKINLYSKRIVKDILVSDTIKNYKNDVLMIKIQYTNALKYYSILQNEDLQDDKIEAYMFLCKMLLEDVIIKLFSIYDKTYHILNVICELKIDENIEKVEFKEKVRNALGSYDNKLKRRVNSVFSRIIKHKFSTYRDNIVHNRSESFFRVKQDYQYERIRVIFQEEKSIEDIIKGVEEIVDLINEQLEIIKNI